MTFSRSVLEPLLVFEALQRGFGMNVLVAMVVANSTVQCDITCRSSTRQPSSRLAICQWHTLFVKSSSIGGHFTFNFASRPDTEMIGITAFMKIKQRFLFQRRSSLTLVLNESLARCLHNKKSGQPRLYLVGMKAFSRFPHANLNVLSHYLSVPLLWGSLRSTARGSCHFSLGSLKLKGRCIVALRSNCDI
jgi:hypothetical protein